ncbi:Sugar phosphate permease [Natronorubrum sediminis]|uniref:Lysosomal dipeptide transporter MFSD1 n=1 Tax=Natronorubrum sediminis TaxID=640943 RepID=A0A1H6G528_9EURY|nr:MFS transporter [Natronorubrum sediminis]SEH18149.1 Sugar phosphate permease [Natronorubrum sediminis]
MFSWSSPYHRRWILWGLLATTFILVNIYRLSTAVISSDLVVALQTTGTQLGTLHAAFFFVYAAMQLPAGILVDRIGPRRTATTGAITMNVGVLWFALTTDYGSALGARLLIGLGGSVIFVSMLRFCANWYRADEFGTMNGLCFAAGGTGGILATTPFAVLVESTTWRTALLSLATFGLIVSVPLFFLVRDSPEGAGLQPVDGVPEQTHLSFREVWTSLLGVLGDRWTWVAGTMLFCTGGVNLTLFGLWGIPYVVQVYDVSVTFASVFTLMGGLGIVVGPPMFGRVTDNIGHRTVFMIAGGVTYVAIHATIALLGTPPLGFIAVAFFLSGALTGTFVLTFPMIKERHGDQTSGISIGTINGSMFLGAALFPTLMGWALDAYWTGELVDGVRVYTTMGYRIAFAIAAGAGCLVVCCTVWLHLREKKSDL